MNHGWVKLHRELLDKSIWTNSTVEQRLLLVQLLLLVTHKPVEYDIYGDKRMLQPGQLLMSLRKLAAECDLGLQVVRTGIDRFEKLGFLTQEVTQRGTLISIVNWGKYQGSDDEANTTSNTRLTQYQHRTNTPIKQECKNVKNVRSKRRALKSPQSNISINNKEKALKNTQSNISIYGDESKNWEW